MKASPSACPIDWPGTGTGPRRWWPRRRLSGVPAPEKAAARAGRCGENHQRLLPAVVLDQHVADRREEELAERTGGGARAERHRPPLFRQQLAEGAEHEIERTARQAEADQHAAADLQHAGRRRIGHDHEARGVEQPRRRREPARLRTGPPRRPRTAARYPRAGSAPRWRARTHPRPQPYSDRHRNLEQPGRGARPEGDQGDQTARTGRSVQARTGSGHRVRTCDAAL